MRIRVILGATIALTLSSCTSNFSHNSLTASASTKRECSTSKHTVRTVRAACEETKWEAKYSSQGYLAVHRAAVKYGVEPKFALAIAKIESGGNCNARSRSGAMGVMQIMPRTARVHGVRNARALLNCTTGAEAGVRELRRLLVLTRGNKRLAAVGYNCGEGCIRRTRWPKETKHYLKRHGY